MAKKVKTVPTHSHLQIVSDLDKKIIDLEMELTQWKSDTSYYKRRISELEEKIASQEISDAKFQSVSEYKRNTFVEAVCRSHYELTRIKPNEMDAHSMQRVLGVVQGNLAVALLQCEHVEVPTVSLYMDEENIKQTLDRVREALGGK